MVEKCYYIIISDSILYYQTKICAGLSGEKRVITLLVAFFEGVECYLTVFSLTYALKRVAEYIIL